MFLHSEVDHVVHVELLNRDGEINSMRTQILERRFHAQGLDMSGGQATSRSAARRPRQCPVARRLVRRGRRLDREQVSGRARRAGMRPGLNSQATYSTVPTGQAGDKGCKKAAVKSRRPLGRRRRTRCPRSP